MGRIQFWMRAYPRRWRAVRGEELTGLVVDLAGPDAQHLGFHAAFDLVRGGWATRWREHPPAHTWVLYRMFDRRIPVVHRLWALDDIDGFWYPLRRILASLVLMDIAVLLFAGLPFNGNGFAFDLVVNYFGLGVTLFVLLSSMIMGPNGARSRARFKHVTPRPHERPVEGTVVVCGVPRERVVAQAALSWAVLILGVIGAASVVAALFAPKVLMLIPVPDQARTTEIVVAPVGRWWVVAAAILLMALAAGMLGAAVARKRLCRRLGERVNQPNRTLRPISATGKANVVFWIMMVITLAWLEVSGWIVLGLSVVLGAVALLLLPAALVALIASRGTAASDLSGSDVWWIVTHGRPPAVDQPVPTLRPTAGPVAERPEAGPPAAVV